MMSSRSVASRRTVPTNRSAWALTRGHRGGLFATWMPASEKTASNEVVNWPAGVVKRRNSMITEVISPATIASTKALHAPNFQLSALLSDYAIALGLPSTPASAGTSRSEMTSGDGRW